MLKSVLRGAVEKDLELFELNFRKLAQLILGAYKIVEVLASTLASGCDEAENRAILRLLSLTVLRLSLPYSFDEQV